MMSKLFLLLNQIESILSCSCSFLLQKLEQFTLMLLCFASHKLLAWKAFVAVDLF